MEKINNKGIVINIFSEKMGNRCILNILDSISDKRYSFDGIRSSDNPDFYGMEIPKDHIPELIGLLKYIYDEKANEENKS